ncbi:hypothetical protein [Paenibacillus chitinolyticus]|uniref:hypothetical protein n=1 Tax=Paenibacillus chitinolyticus TaxID=79263 RepID=UPI00366E7A92
MFILSIKHLKKKAMNICEDDELFFEKFLLSDDYFRENDDIEAVTFYIERKYSSKSFLNLIFYLMDNSGAFTNRKDLLRELRQLYKKRYYYGALTLGITQLEHMVVSFNKFEGRLHQKELIRLIKKTYPEEDSFYMNLHLEYVMCKFEHGKEIKSKISRHGIAHGGVDDHGNAINAYRCLILLGHLSTIISNKM